MLIISEITKKYKSIPREFDIENVYCLETQQEYYEGSDKNYYQLIDIDKPIILYQKEEEAIRKGWPLFCTAIFIEFKYSNLLRIHPTLVVTNIIKAIFEQKLEKETAF